MGTSTRGEVLLETEAAGLSDPNPNPNPDVRPHPRGSKGSGASVKAVMPMMRKIDLSLISISNMILSMIITLNLTRRARGTTPKRSRGGGGTSFGSTPPR